MKRLYAMGAIAALSFVVTVAALPILSRGNAASIAIGSIVADFKLADANGKEHSLATLRAKNGTVLIFVSTSCPVSNAYNPRMEKLAQDYQAKGIQVVGINANVKETPEAIKQHAAENGLTFPILKDTGNKIADLLDAKVTPEAYFLDASNKLLYRGRIDDKAPNRGEATVNDLRNAIEARLAGKAIEKPEALAFGCGIKRG